MTEEKAIYKIEYQFVPDKPNNCMPEDYLKAAERYATETVYVQPEEKAMIYAAIAMAQAMNDLVHVMENVLKIMESKNENQT